MEKIKEVHFTNEYGLKDTWTYRGNRLIKTEFRYPRINNKKKIMSLIKILNKKYLMILNINQLMIYTPQ